MHPAARSLCDSWLSCYRAWKFIIFSSFPLEDAWLLLQPLSPLLVVVVPNPLICLPGSLDLCCPCTELQYIPSISVGCWSCLSATIIYRLLFYIVLGKSLFAVTSPLHRLFSGYSSVILPLLLHIPCAMLDPCCFVFSYLSLCCWISLFVFPLLFLWYWSSRLQCSALFHQAEALLRNPRFVYPSSFVA